MWNPGGFMGLVMASLPRLWRTSISAGAHKVVHGQRAISIDNKWISQQGWRQRRKRAA
jgi:hypothetical protein